MRRGARLTLAVLLLGVATGCGYLAIATGEASPDARAAFWLLYAAPGLVGVVGGVWLLLPRRANAEPVVAPDRAGPTAGRDLYLRSPAGP